MRQPLRVHGRSHVGLVHHTNEDSWAIFDTEQGQVLLVCDGMGGMGRGDQASQMAVRLLQHSMAESNHAPGDTLRDCLMEADRNVRSELCDGEDGWAGCTAAVVLVTNGRAHLAWVGDSRVYHIRHGHVAERTRDHKLIEDLIEAGEMTREEAQSSSLANVITRALGGRPPSASDVEPSTLGPWVLEPGDQILLCSDGLCDLVSDDEIAQTTSSHDLRGATQVLVDLALARGGHDNITIVLGQFEGSRAYEDDIPTQVMPIPEEVVNAGNGPPPAEPVAVEVARVRTVEVPLVLAALGGLLCALYVVVQAVLA